MREQGLVRRALRVAVGIAAAGLLLGGCGVDEDRGVNAAPVEVDLVAGNAVLPSMDDPLVAGSSIDTIRAPDDLSPDAEAAVGYVPGRVVLYGDPTLEDPFDGSWVFAVLLQGSETSGLGGEFDPRGTDTRWVDVPVEQLSQEGRQAGLLTAGLDPSAAAELAGAVEVSGSDSSTSAIEISGAALRAVSDRLEPLVAADVDAAFLGASGGLPGAVPAVAWSRHDANSWARVAVSSWAARPGLELLLRATTGGAQVGPNVMPVGGEGAIDQIVALVVIGDTLAHVQAQRIPVDEVASFSERLSPVGPERWSELRDAAFVQPARGTSVPDAQVVLDEIFGDVRFRSELGVARVEGEFGPFDSCRFTTYSTLRSGLSVPGGLMISTACPERGNVQLVTVDDRTIVHGVASPSTESVRLMLTSGEVRELQPEGDEWQLYVGEVAGVDTILEAQAIAANGSVIGRLDREGTPTAGSLALGSGAFQAPG